jgi:hypothetical protein
MLEDSGWVALNAGLDENFGCWGAATSAMVEKPTRNEWSDLASFWND